MAACRSWLLINLFYASTLFVISTKFLRGPSPNFSIFFPMFAFSQITSYAILVQSLILPEYLEGGELKWKAFLFLLSCLLWPVLLHITYANGQKNRTSDVETQKTEGCHPPFFVLKWNQSFYFFYCISSILRPLFLVKNQRKSAFFTLAFGSAKRLSFSASKYKK